MENVRNMTQPAMKKLFYAEQIRLTEKAWKLVLQIYLALGGDLSEYGEVRDVMEISRGQIHDWRSYTDAVTYDQVASREEYNTMWQERFPDEVKVYEFIARNMPDGLSLTVSDGNTSVVLVKGEVGDYMIPQVSEILKYALAEFVTQKTAI